MEFCSCSWQPATPEGNSSLWLPTREPCPCSVELDGAQTERSPARKQGRAVCATAEPRAQGSDGACGGSQRPHRAVPNPCPCLALNQPQKHLFSYTTCFQHTGCTQQEKLSWTTTTTTQVLMDQHSHTFWSHPPTHGCLQRGLKTFTGSGTRGAWHGRGDSHTKPFTHEEHPFPGVPQGHCHLPVHHAMSWPHRPWGADGAVTRKCSAAAQEYPGSEAGMGCLSHSWMGSDWQIQHKRTTPGTPPVCTASKVLPASWASSCTH